MYHLVPNEEAECHDATSACLCDPVRVIAGNDFWLGEFIGFEFYRHERFSPLTDSRFFAIGEEVPV